jgi:hypothetical protein
LTFSLIETKNKAFMCAFYQVKFFNNPFKCVGCFALPCLSWLCFALLNLALHHFALTITERAFALDCKDKLSDL